MNVAWIVGLLVAAAWSVGRSDPAHATGLRRVRSHGSEKRCRAWTLRGRLRRAEPVEPSVTLLLDLCAGALAAGLPAAGALQVAGRATGGSLGRWCDVAGVALMLGADQDAAWADAPSELDALRRAVQLVGAAGVPGGPLLRGAATAERTRERLAYQARAQALGVRMVLPLGLCALPAFAAWGVVPVVLALAGQVL